MRLVLSLVAVLGMVSSFTVAPATKSFHRAATLAEPVEASSTALSALPYGADPAIIDMISKTPPEGSLLMGVLVAAFWFQINKGRA